MPVHRITVTESFAEIDPGERRARVDFATIPGTGWSRAGIDGHRAWPDSGTDNGSALDLSTWGLAIGNTFTDNFARLPGG